MKLVSVLMLLASTALAVPVVGPSRDVQKRDNVGIPPPPWDNGPPRPLIRSVDGEIEDDEPAPPPFGTGPPLKRAPIVRSTDGEIEDDDFKGGDTHPGKPPVVRSPDDYRGGPPGDDRSAVEARDYNGGPPGDEHLHYVRSAEDYGGGPPGDGDH